MKTIRCAFVDFWSGFIPQRIYYLFDNYDVVIDNENPDYLFYSCFGITHLKYRSCVKIFWCGENIEPDFNDCDYAVSYSEIRYGDRTLRNYRKLARFEKLLPEMSADVLLNRKFCNFIYSNNACADPFRVQFFEALSKYKKIDSGGGLLNNIGYCVSDKQSFQNQYKFSLAIENSSLPGYTTEKIVDPFFARSLPIYWGNPHVHNDYNPVAFVNLMDYASVEQMVEEVIRLDNDDAAYLEKVTAPFWPEQYCSLEDFRQQERDELCDFYAMIFNQPKEQAFRRTMYGANASFKERYLPCPFWRRVFNALKRRSGLSK